ncbi:hypothetical protein Tco_1521920, partial [Tanacetum coccineum]
TANVPVTAGAKISTASPEVKTAGDSVDKIVAKSLMYIKRSAAKTKDKGNHTLHQLKRLSFDELKILFEATMRRVGTFVPMETKIRREVPELVAGSSKRDAEEKLDQGSSKRLYDTCGVHHVSTKDGVDIYMLVEKEYPLSRGVLTQMLAAKLLMEQNNEMSKELLRKIFMQVERTRI